MSKRKPRKARPKYDSRWEEKLHTGLLKSWQHHGERIHYIIEHNYEPDFIKSFPTLVGSSTILLEAKGRFWDFAEYSKYTWVKKALPENVELVFLFSNPTAPMPQAKKRRDGTKRSHAEWADKNNFRWFSEESLPKSWR